MSAWYRSFLAKPNFLPLLKEKKHTFFKNSQETYTSFCICFKFCGKTHAQHSKKDFLWCVFGLFVLHVYDEDAFNREWGERNLWNVFWWEKNLEGREREKKPWWENTTRPVTLKTFPRLKGILWYIHIFMSRSTNVWTH